MSRNGTHVLKVLPAFCMRPLRLQRAVPLLHLLVRYSSYMRRCGEYANCFSLVLSSLGFDTRHIVDFTDHVWCEVWLDVVGKAPGDSAGPQPGRWVHCDPAEAASDSPLMYEQGWGKVS